MDRRRFVGSVAAGVGAFVGGCTGGIPADGGTEPTTATAIDEHAFTKRRTTRREQTTDVSFEAESQSVTVDGTMVVGSSSCYDAALDRLEYDAGVLDVRINAAFVGERDEEGATMCTTDVVWREYDLDVQFEDGLPDRVEVTVEDGHGETRTVVEER